ncbi:hypothetical protein HDV03_002550 [Kappamyces sp. JEL0829]|nr:hypothetical protein HDV03_002550 [Kappamyces sp. JEL0829]
MNASPFPDSLQQYKRLFLHSSTAQSMPVSRPHPLVFLSIASTRRGKIIKKPQFEYEKASRTALKKPVLSVLDSHLQQKPTTAGTDSDSKMVLQRTGAADKSTASANDPVRLLPCTLFPPRASVQDQIEDRPELAPSEVSQTKPIVSEKTLVQEACSVAAADSALPETSRETDKTGKETSKNSSQQGKPAKPRKIQSARLSDLFKVCLRHQR